MSPRLPSRRFTMKSVLRAESRLCCFQLVYCGLFGNAEPRRTQPPSLIGDAGIFSVVCANKARELCALQTEEHSDSDNLVGQSSEGAERPADTPKPDSAKTENVTEAEKVDQPKEQKEQRNRCGVCRKKLGLTGFQCRCGGYFCAIHRYSDKHVCSFDYREHGAAEIRRNNPVVIAEKVKKL